MISARPPESRSSSANCSKNANRVVRAEHGHGAREPDALGSRRDRREHDRRCGDDEIGPVMLADAENVEPELVRELGLLEEVAHPLRRRNGAGIGEGGQSELHDRKIP
jgi:hypothetical protein